MAKAALVGDFHTCNMVEVNKPHIGGPIEEGSNDVKINSKPAVTVGCKAICVGGSMKDAVIMGSSTVFINGKPAARVGDMTVHAGKIEGPGSMNVNIG